MKKLALSLILGLCCFAAFAQPAVIDLRQDTVITATDTLTLVARQTNVVADITAGSVTITLDEPSVDYAGFQVTIVQLNAASGRKVTVTCPAATGILAGSDAATYDFTADTYESKTFTCMNVGSSTYRWVLTHY